MKTVYFVRHGESEGNVGNIYQSADTPLTDKGREQARAVAERCAKLKFDTLISSTMIRAAETARIIGEKTGHTPELSELFIERYRPDELHRKSRSDPEIAHIGKAWFDSIFNGGPRILNGENFDDMKARAIAALKHLQNHPSDNILVASHGFFLRLLVAVVIFGNELTAGEFKQIVQSFRMNNTGIMALQYGMHHPDDIPQHEDKWILRVWNDHAHLG